MKEPNRERKGEIKAINAIQLNEEQKEAKRLIFENQIVIVTGRAGSGKSLVCAQAALDFLNKKMTDKVFTTRATIETGTSMGFLPGPLEDKMNPYLEAIIENLEKCCSDKGYVAKLLEEKKLQGWPIQFVRGKTMDAVLIIEEAQNLTKGEMLALLTRLGKTGHILINGDNDQQDVIIKDGSMNGLQYVTRLSKHIEEIKHIHLKTNHRSDLVGKILDYEYSK